MINLRHIMMILTPLFLLIGLFFVLSQFAFIVIILPFYIKEADIRISFTGQVALNVFAHSAENKWKIHIDIYLKQGPPRQTQISKSRR